MWDSAANINVVSDIKTISSVYFGIGAVGKMSRMADELVKKNINRVIVVFAKGTYKKTVAWDTAKKALEEKNINFVLYSEITPNPTVRQIADAAEIASDFGATAVIAIYGGSPFDAAKSTAVLIANKCKIARDVYELKFAAEKSAPVIAGYLTHITGTEINSFAAANISER